MDATKVLDSAQRGIANGKTTLAGTGLGSAYYLGNVGLQAPQSKADWINLGIAVLFQVLGLLAKDATTGSAPPVTLSVPAPPVVPPNRTP